MRNLQGKLKTPQRHSSSIILKETTILYFLVNILLNRRLHSLQSILSPTKRFTAASDCFNTDGPSGTNNKSRFQLITVEFCVCFWIVCVWKNFYLFVLTVRSKHTPNREISYAPLPVNNVWKQRNPKGSDWRTAAVLLCVCTKRSCSLKAPHLWAAEAADNTDDKMERNLTEFDQLGQDGQPGNISAVFIRKKSSWMAWIQRNGKQEKKLLNGLLVDLVQWGDEGTP